MNYTKKQLMQIYTESESSRMKVAFVCPRFYPHIGGVETVVFQLASHISKQGLDVTVLTQSHNAKLPKKEHLDNFTVRRFHELGIGNDIKISLPLLQYLQICSGQYDLVHAHNYHAFPSLAAALTKKGRPLIFSPHYHGGGHTSIADLLHVPYRLIGKFIFSQSDTILCDTDAEAQLVRKDFPQYGPKIHLISLGINVEAIKYAKRSKSVHPYVVTIGRLENYKNVELIIKSMQFIDQKVHLQVVGNGPSMEHLKILTSRLNLTKRIFFLGNLPEDRLFQLLKTAKVYINLSSKEAYNLSLAEAAVAEVGIVVSDISTHRELAKRFGINPISFVQTGSSPQMVAHYVMVAMGSPSKTKILPPSWDTVAKHTIQIYATALKSHAVT